MQTRAVVQDLTDPDVGTKVADATDGLDVGLLIYNAGASDRIATFLETEVDYSLKQIKLDCIGPIALAHHFGTAMRVRGRGGIVLSRRWHAWPVRRPLRFIRRSRLSSTTSPKDCGSSSAHMVWTCAVHRSV